MTKLEVDGGLRIGDDSGTCNAGYSGTMRYTDTNGLEICDGLLWGGVGSGTVINSLNDITDVDAGAPTDRQILAWNATDGEWEPVDILHGGIVEYNQSISGLTEIQSDMSTHWGYEATAFEINNETYLIFANQYDGNASDVPQRIFKWNGLKFIEHQLLGNDYGRMFGAKHVSADGKDYLVLTENEGEDDAPASGETYLLKWNTGTEQFDLVQTLSSTPAHRSTSFSIGGTTYVALASRYNGTSYAIGSNIYQLNTTTDQLDYHQTINTVGATDIEYYSIGSDHYLAYTSYTNGSSNVLDSQIHKWDSGSGAFDNTPTQLLNMNGAYAVEYTTIDGEHYLIFTTLNSNTVEVWQWNGAAWVAFQSLTDSVEGLRRTGLYH